MVVTSRKLFLEIIYGFICDMDKRFVSCILVASVALGGCAVVHTKRRSETKLGRLRVGDSREDVVKKLGSPDVSLLPEKRELGIIVQFEEYMLYPPKLSRFVLFSGLPSATMAWWKPNIWYAEANPYWLKYADGKLQKWGPPEEFPQEPAISSGTVNAVAASTATLTIPITSTGPIITSDVLTSTGAVTASTATWESPAVSSAPVGTSQVPSSTTTLTAPAISTTTR